MAPMNSLGRRKENFHLLFFKRCLLPLRYISDKFIYCKHFSSNLKFQWRE